MTRHFIDIADLSDDDLRVIIDDARSRKEARKGWPKGKVDADAPLDGYALAMIFEKPSTRTRVSFDMGMQQLGGRPLLLRGDELQLGRGETIEDTAQVLSRMVDAIMIRTDDHDKLHGLADAGSIPVINGLTDDSHPCQIMADILTYEEHKGGIKGAKIAWTGDGNNMATSWIEAAAAFDFELRLGCPEQLAPSDAAITAARAKGAKIILTDKAEDAVEDADCVMADTWVSMGDKDAENRHNILKPYQVDEALMGRAKKDAIFMHCLPAHREEEVTTAVIDGPQSVVFDEAENRLHAQKAILLWCLEKI